MNRYSLLIQRSDEDKCYFGVCPEFESVLNMGGPFCHGTTWADAAREAMIVVKGVMETIDGPLPEPQLYEYSRRNDGAKS